jgi:hypothetical protein
MQPRVQPRSKPRGQDSKLRALPVSISLVPSSNVDETTTCSVESGKKTTGSASASTVDPFKAANASSIAPMTVPTLKTPRCSRRQQS